jgi:hypothetical protein
MKCTFLAFLLVALTQASALLVQPRVTTPALRGRVAQARMQFGGKPEKEGGLTRDNEPDEFFKSDFDDMSDEEKLKSPVVLGGAPITHQQSAPALKKIVHSWTYIH